MTTPDTLPLQLDLDAVRALLADVFPQVDDGYRIQALEPGRAVVTLDVGHGHLRPGGTVSGPTMFTVADLAFYVATLGLIGAEALAVTTHSSIDFMRKPGTGQLRAEASVLKLGRGLSVGHVLVWSEGIEGPVAQASMTYSLPPPRL